jgi:hypothetical protein
VRLNLTGETSHQKDRENVEDQIADHIDGWRASLAEGLSLVILFDKWSIKPAWARGGRGARVDASAIDDALAGTGDALGGAVP